MILANATIYTADPARPFAGAMAIRAGRVLRVGAYESVKELKGRHTHELNLSGNVVLPGFIDSHVHFIDGGLQVVPLPNYQLPWPPVTLGHLPIPNCHGLPARLQCVITANCFSACTVLAC